MEVKKVKKQETAPVKKEKKVKHTSYLVNVRWDHPHFGSIPMPPRVTFYGFVTFVTKSANFPTSAQLKKMALEKEGVKEENLVITSISVVPANHKV